MTKPMTASIVPDTRPHVDVPFRDHQAIVDALYRFGAGQDLRDHALFASAFSPEAIVDFSQPARRLGVTVPIFQGRELITDTIMSSTAPLHTTHTVTNPRVISYDGERATLFALVEAQHVLRSEPSRRLLLKNIYTVKESVWRGVWTIDEMRIENVWMTGEAAVLFPQAPSR
jgi:hypothetical protein